MTSDKDIHARKRRLLNLAFTERSLKAAVPFLAKHIDRWNDLLLSADKEPRSNEWSDVRDMKIWADYLVFDILGDLCFGAGFETKEPGNNDFKKIPAAFDTFVTFNYSVSHPVENYLPLLVSN
jgi:cytochrome P450